MLVGSSLSLRLAPRFAAPLYAACVALALGLATPSTASADPGQLCRAGANLLFAPLDLALSPFIAGKDLYYGLTEIDDPLAIKVIGAAPGYAFLVGLQLGGGAIRGIAGGLEILPGLITFFREGEQGALYRSQDEAWALYSEDFGPCPVRLGTSYQTINEG